MLYILYSHCFVRKPDSDAWPDGTALPRFVPAVPAPAPRFRPCCDRPASSRCRTCITFVSHMLESHLTPRILSRAN